MDSEVQEGYPKPLPERFSPVIQEKLEDLHKQEQELQSKEGMSWPEIKGSIKGLKRKKGLEHTYDWVVERIKDETQWFKEYEKMGLLPGFFKGFKNLRLPEARISWERFKLAALLVDNPWAKPQGHFSATDRTVHVYHAPPGKEAVLNYLAGGGNVPMAISALAHENTHSYQFPNPITKKQEGIYYKSKSELLEAQAFTESSSADSSIEDIVKYQLSRYGRFHNRQKVEYAVKAVFQLYALGFTVKDVGQMIINSGEWDNEKAVYPEIQSVIEQKTKELGLTGSDLDGLVEVYQIEKHIDKLKARQITQEELQKAD